MHRRRWLIVGLCFCVFSGCVSCQGNYDYCGPMPDQGGDFMYRKNSVLGGDPSKPLAAGTTPTTKETDETGPEPTPAPPPDQEPVPGMDLDESTDDMAPEDDEARQQSYEEEADESSDEVFDEELTLNEPTDNKPVSRLQWHAPTHKPTQSPIRQVRFSSE
jgi:hypothetical protein